MDSAADETLRATSPERASVTDRVSLSGGTPEPDLLHASVERMAGAAQMSAGITVVRTVDESIADLLSELG